MKQCPQCGSIYSDDTLNFCLTDRSSLVSMPQPDEMATLATERVSTPRADNLSHSSNVSPVLKYLAVALAAFVLLIGIVGIAILYFLNTRTGVTGPSNSSTPVSIPSQPVASPDKRSTPIVDRTPAATPAVSPTDIPRKDPGTSRITFRKGSVGEVVRGVVNSRRTFVVRTMAGQTLSGSVNSSGDCVIFDEGNASLRFTTISGDNYLTIRNVCDEPSAFNLNVTVQ